MAVTVLVPEALAIAPLSEVEGVELLPYTDPSAWPPGAETAEALVVGWGPVEPVVAQLGALASLRLLQVLGAGFEDWLGRVPDGVVLSNARGAHGAPTAEWALAALLAVVRELPGFVRTQATQAWDKHETGTLIGARVLVLGAGDLAVELRRRLEANDTVVTLVGRSAREGVVGRDSLDGLLPEQDAVVAMVPLDDSTRGMVDAAFLARLRDGAIVVNAARGPVVDTDALLAELQSGRLRAALDVTDPEPLPAGHPLWSAPNLLITPHVGGTTPGATERALRVLGAELARYVAGEPLQNVQDTTVPTK
jgi:phosphoglycerate dehydrogenase-like enzyme